MRPYLSEIVIQPGSSLAGKTLGQANVAQQLGLTVLKIVRDKNQKTCRSCQHHIARGRRSDRRRTARLTS